MSPDQPETNRGATGVGLGFRLDLANQILRKERFEADFVEVAPENYLGIGGRRKRLLDAAKERFEIVCHGLCGDFSGSAPLDLDLLSELKAFLRDVDAKWYSDHLCFTHAAGAELHDLLPLPLNQDAVQRAAKRIAQIQDFLEMPVAIENVSAYARMPGCDLDEADFIRAVVEEANCHLLLDVNNVFVNASNFDFDAKGFIDRLPLERVIQLHIAGHDVEDDGLRIDTHGAPILDPVFDLFGYATAALARRGVAADVPMLLERDHNFPPLFELEAELARLKTVRKSALAALDLDATRDHAGRDDAAESVKGATAHG